MQGTNLEARHTTKTEVLCSVARLTGTEGLTLKAWEPGKPVATESDREQWLAWRKARKRQQQIDRRARLRRIDYYASPDTGAALDRLWKPQGGHDFSSILDRIIRDWLAGCARNKVQGD